MYRLLILFLCTTLCAAEADEFPIVIGESGANSIPGFADQIVQALAEYDLQATLEVVPGDRAFTLLERGEVALDLVRSQMPMKDISWAKPISTPIRTIRMMRTTAVSTPEKCTQETNDFSIVGVHGVKIFEGKLIKQYREIIWAPSEDHAIRMIAAGRGDITFWVEQYLKSLSEEQQRSIHICSENSIEIDLYSYLHRDYEWARPTLESIYKALFSTAD